MLTLLCRAALFSGGKWRSACGDLTEEVANKYKLKTLDAVREAVKSNRIDTLGASEDYYLRSCRRVLSEDFRPGGEPEIVATYRTVSDSERLYRVVADYRNGGVVFDVVYDDMAQAVFGCIHETGISTYAGALNAIAIILHRLEKSNERGAAVIKSEACRNRHAEIWKQHDEQLERQEVERKKAQEDAEAERIAQASARERVFNAAAGVKCKRNKVGITLTLESFREKKIEPVDAYVFGSLMLHKGWVEGVGAAGPYMISHIATGLGVCPVPYRESLLRDAKVFLFHLESVGDWDFSLPEKSPAANGKIVRDLSRAWRDGNFVGVEKILEREKRHVSS